jgi:hypothetical protein
MPDVLTIAYPMILLYKYSPAKINKGYKWISQKVFLPY